MVLGTRYPTLAFHTGGAGQAQDGIPPQPFETFCYDSALLEAKIENFNVIPYTSVLPKELFGKIYPVDKVAKFFKHGAVLEVIMAGNGARKEDHKADRAQRFLPLQAERRDDRAAHRQHKKQNGNSECHDFFLLYLQIEKYRLLYGSIRSISVMHASGLMLSSCMRRALSR